MRAELAMLEAAFVGAEDRSGEIKNP